MYLPTVARWASVDPLGFAYEMNLFTYGRLHPAGVVDPTGLQPAIPMDDITRLLQLIAGGGAAAQAALAALRSLILTVPGIGAGVILAGIGVVWCLDRGATNCRAGYRRCLKLAAEKVAMQLDRECEGDKVLRRFDYDECSKRLGTPLVRRCQVELLKCVFRCGYWPFRQQSTVIPAGVDCKELCVDPPLFACKHELPQQIA